MGLIISNNQLRVSRSEYTLHRFERQPFFRINTELMQTDTTNFYDTEILKISNEGEVIRNFECTPFVFYTFNILNKNNEQSALFVVNDFYLFKSYTNNLKGDLYRAFTLGNNLEFYNVYIDCLQYSKEGIFIEIQKLVYLKLTYTDIIGEEHIDFYNSNGYVVDEDEINLTLEASGNNNRILNMRDFNIDFIDSLIKK
jgi:hypothetical protein